MRRIEKFQYLKAGLNEFEARVEARVAELRVNCEVAYEAVRHERVNASPFEKFKMRVPRGIRLRMLRSINLACGSPGPTS